VAAGARRRGGGRRRTVLHVAAESGAPTALAAVELLVGAGAAVCAEDEDGWTPCDRAILLKRACNMKVGVPTHLARCNERPQRWPRR
jgi:hypothetical protein